MTLASLAKFPLSLLLQPIRPSFSAGPASHGANVLAVANGLDRAHADKRLTTNSSDDLFSLAALDVNQLKVDLFERVGKALGVGQDDYDTARAYGFALKMAVMQIMADPNGAQIIAGIESNLGLDKLGISLRVVMNAIVDSTGPDAGELEAALGRQAGELGLDRAVELDDIGIYRPVR